MAKTKIPKQDLKPQEMNILKALLEHNYWLSTTEVAREAGISWNTAKAYLDKMYKLSWIGKMDRGNIEYWRASR